MSTSFLLDTDVVSNLRKAKPHPRLLAWLRAVPRDAVFMAVATVTEIQCGIDQVDDPGVAHRVQHWLDGLLGDEHPRVAAFGARAAVLLGRMWAMPSLNNFIVNDPRSRKVRTGADLAIAATAIAQGMAVASGNTRDFLEIHAVFPLPGLFNPFAGHWAIDPLPGEQAPP